MTANYVVFSLSLGVAEPCSLRQRGAGQLLRPVRRHGQDSEGPASPGAHQCEQEGAGGFLPDGRHQPRLPPHGQVCHGRQTAAIEQVRPVINGRSV